MNNYLRGILLVGTMPFFQIVSGQTVPDRKATIDEGTYVAAKTDAVAKASDSDWKSLGMGKFRDDLITTFYYVDNYEFEVEVQESTLREGLYRLVSPYKNYPVSPATFEIDTYMEVDASNPEKVFFDRYNTGMDWGNGYIQINSIAGDYYFEYGGGTGLDMAYAEGYCGTLKDGAITFPAGSLLITDDTLTPLWSQSNRNGKFRLLLPGAPDLDVSITVGDVVEKEGKEFISVNFVFDDDIEKAKVAMLEGEYSSSSVDGIVAGTIPSEEMTASGEHLFPYEKDGVFTIIAVPYYGGEAKNAEYVTEEFSYRHEGWNDVGTAMYTEGFIADCEVTVDNMSTVTTAVAVQQNTESPGLFRLVDPYGPGYEYYSEQNYDASHRYYMEIDATDPERVFINEMSDGCGMSFTFGRTMLWSRAGYYLDSGMTQEEVDTKGVYGKRDGNVITFPKNALLIKFSDVVDTWYWANCNGSFKVVLPEGVGISAAVVNESVSDSPVEFYTLDGMKVDAANLRPGIYVRKQGTVVSKVVIR